MKRTRNWATLIYPRVNETDETKCPEDWAEIISKWGVRVCVSPLHDKDVKEDGTPKKPHRHVLVAFDGVKDVEQVRELFESVGGVGCEPINSLYAQVRYLTHMDNPEKAQYSAVDVLTFGGFSYKAYATNKEDEEKDTAKGMGEICHIINEKGIFEFADLADYLLGENPELFLYLRKNSYFFGQYIKSRQNIYKNMTNI